MNKRSLPRRGYIQQPRVSEAQPWVTRDFSQTLKGFHKKAGTPDADRIACLEAALLGKEAAATSLPDPTPDPLPITKTEPDGIGASQVIARTQSKEEMLQQLERAEGLVVVGYDADDTGLALL